MTNIAQVAVEALQLFGDTSLFVNEFAEAGLDWGGVWAKPKQGAIK